MKALLNMGISAFFAIIDFRQYRRFPVMQKGTQRKATALDTARFTQQHVFFATS